MNAVDIERRLADLGVVLTAPVPPAVNYVPAVLSGSYLHISGQLPIAEGRLRFVGQLSRDADIEAGQAAARLCAINVLAHMKVTLSDLGRVKQVVKLVGFVNSAPGFGAQPKVVNGASDLIVDVLGDAGRHARSAVGVADLPFGASVEIEALVEVS